MTCLVDVSVDQIWARKSNARGDVSDEVRPHTAAAYGFREGATTSNERHNVALYTKLIKNGAFHHKVCPFL